MRAALALAVAVALCAPALALEAVVLPGRALEADGARVHLLRLFVVDGGAPVAGVPSVRAAHGAVVGAPVPATGGGFSLRYRPPRVARPERDTLAVTVDGRTAQAPIALKPAGRVTLELAVSPDPLVLQKGQTAELRVSVRDAAGQPARAPLRLGASVGRLSSLKEVAPGDYRAVYTPPEERYPQVAILAAVSVADGAFAAAPLRLAARVTVPGEGEPGATMTIAVGGRSFGPQTIGPDGRFAIPLVVPPGGRAVGTSTDKLGNVQTRPIDLKLPPFPRLLLAVVPPELPADGRSRAEVVAFAVDARGAPESSRAPALKVDRGALSRPEARAPGAFSWTYTAPAEVGDGQATFTAGAARGVVKLRPAPPFEIVLGAIDEPLPAGASKPAAIPVRVRDASGSPVTGARLVATLGGGRVVGVDELGRGAYAIRAVLPKDPGKGAAPLHVELGGLEPGPPRRVTLHAVPAPPGQLAAEAWIDDDLGLPVAGAEVTLRSPAGLLRAVTDRYGTARVAFPQPEAARCSVTAEPAALPGLEAALDFLRAGERVFAVSSVAGRGVVEGAPVPPQATLEAEVPLRPASPVDVIVLSEPAVVGRDEPARIRVRVTTDEGKPLDGAILYEASEGRVELVRPLQGGAAELRFIPPAGARRGTRFIVTVTEPKSRVTGFAEITAR